MFGENTAKWKGTPEGKMCQTQESDLKVFQMETQAWHAPLEKLKQVLQQEILHSVCWGTVLINNGYSLAFNWISSPFTIWCSLFIFRRYFSHEEPQHFAVTVPRTSLLALGPDKLLLNACLYYSWARQKIDNSDKQKVGCSKENGVLLTC